MRQILIIIKRCIPKLVSIRWNSLMIFKILTIPRRYHGLRWLVSLPYFIPNAKKNILFFVFLSGATSGIGQTARYADVNLGVGKSEGTLALAYFHNWQFGHHKRIEVGVGARFTSYLGANKYYTTAPAKLTSGKTGPSVLFAENIPANIDTFIIKYPQVNSLNLAIDLGYRLNDKWKIGFNIDFIGFSFGNSPVGNFVSLSSNSGKMVTSKPTAFNLLLISDNDLGNLNSELYTKYFFNDRWGVKAGFQFLFTEFKTKTPAQELPEFNDRFRLKSLLFSLGISRKF